MRYNTIQYRLHFVSFFRQKSNLYNKHNRITELQSEKNHLE